MENATPNPTDGKPCSVSAWPYALFVPVLVVMAHDAEASFSGYSFRNALVAQPFHLGILIIMGVIALLSYFAIRPFTGRATSRWFVFLACVVFFSALAISFLPKLAE